MFIKAYSRLRKTAEKTDSNICLLIAMKHMCTMAVYRTMKIKRKVTTHLNWKCQGGLGWHHKFYDLNYITASKLDGGRVELYFDIAEADDGESVPCGKSQKYLKRMKEKLEALQTEGVIEEVTFDRIYHWPNKLRMLFILRKGEQFVKGSIGMCLRILDILEARYPLPDNISIEHAVSLEVTPGHFVPENLWIVRQAEEAISISLQQK